jgi:hypothetical protein
MEKKDIKKGLQEAKKEVKQDLIDRVKELAKRTLEKIEALQKDRDNINMEIAILKKDIQDLSEGRLDRIEERQEKDPLALKSSVAKVEKVVVKETEIHHHYDRWYDPWKITYLVQPPIYSSAGVVVNTLDPALNQGDGLMLMDSFTINCSAAKDHTEGVYQLSTGVVRYITK